MAAVAHLGHEVCPDALPYIDQDYEEVGVRDMVRLLHFDAFSLKYRLFENAFCHWYDGK